MRSSPEHSNSGAVQRELTTLAGSGLVTVRSVGNQKHYQANADAPIFEELRGIVHKTFGLAEPLRQVLSPLAKKLVAAFVYGSVAKNTDTATSDIDLMVISDELTYPDLFAALEAANAVIGRTKPHDPDAQGVGQARQGQGAVHDTCARAAEDLDHRRRQCLAA